MTNDHAHSQNTNMIMCNISGVDKFHRDASYFFKVLILEEFCEQGPVFCHITTSFLSFFLLVILSNFAFFFFTSINASSIMFKC